MHDARRVANYFLDRAHQRNVEVTVMTLLKVLYFAHGEYLARFDAPLVAQPFEAWQYGPVNRVVYDQLKGLGAKPIRTKLQIFDATTCGYVEASADFRGEAAQFLNNIFDYYARFHPFRLSDLTHEQGSPWQMIWEMAETKAVPGMHIPNALIKKWFREEGLRASRS